jgi:hypothetical protein
VEKWARVQNLSFKNVRVQDVTTLVAGKNVPAARPMDSFSLTDISGTCARGITLANMTNVKLSGIRVSGFEGPLITTENVKGTGLELSAMR